MTSFAWSEHKGFCIDPGYSPSKEPSITTNGIDELPWDKYIVQENVDDNPTTKNGPNEPTTNKKLTKSEKRELRQNKKVNVQRRKQMQRQMELDSSNIAIEATFKPYLAKQELKQLYDKIIKKTTTAKSGVSDFKVAHCHSISVYKSDLEHILPGEWINDNNISLIYELIKETFIDSGSCRPFTNQIQLLFPSVVQLVQHFPASDIENLLPMDDLKKSKFIFLPINMIDEPLEELDLETANNGDHWVLGILSLLDDKLYIYDSMRIDDDIKGDQQLQNLCKKLESCSNLVRGKIKVVQLSCDQQRNFDDCGVFVVMITCYLVNQFCFRDEISLDLAHVKFNPLDARLSLMKLISNFVS
ncbi:Ulp1 protease family, C-terminal catalytic domain protein [Candida parapsilosis]|uniref:ULP_PROTEASE domain-containing protein n=2 Tax=Candida parapsilosis TaxID=5480 RepID=G8BJ18_CANPC|nr:uncharacterized protein CPAR2_404370 [Candida parapsilosis]KAF6045998.1 Ulp1 protease family, C-terminal catalytic domain protein [Candida parapsilosis]KAF6046451.1 Ulp1 protease family, C-terminal catalytic domain protein [Candida parapsilosis]KAF6051108.1 Ulp1 protease family, C-terminal catalytic domain protein [Candida parapsilosis]KAF6062169.1 Ulp1 protease family, C-terminal catalytic domain protein [Candida parapsilosis]CAD1812157.1 unnamed protein product [Candida parapsilosis]